MSTRRPILFRLQALLALLALVVAAADLDALCFCGACPRSQAIGVFADATEDVRSPCCRRAAAAAALRHAEAGGDSLRREGCCGTHDGELAAARATGPRAEAPSPPFQAISASDGHPWMGPTLASAEPAPGPHATAPPRLQPTATYLLTLRIRV